MLPSEFDDLYAFTLATVDDPAEKMNIVVPLNQ
jgi:hypothetical protein